MSSRQRTGLIVVAAIVAIAAFLVLRPSDEEEDDSPPPATAPAQTRADRPAPQARPREPEVTTIRVRDGKPVGGVEEIEAEKGDTVRLRIDADGEHEVHVHGYDLSEDTAAGKPAELRFKAKIEGIFEIELEDTKTQIAELTVEP